MDISDIKHLISERAANFLGRGSFQLLIDGKWEYAQAGATLDVINPATEGLIGKVAAAGPSDVGLAVKAARRAFDEGPWSRCARPSASA